MKKTGIAAAAVLLAALLVTGAMAASFSDISGHWAEGVIEKWNGKNVLYGYDGKFMPDDSIRRGDIAVLINRVWTLDEKAENTFADLDDNAYYTDAVLRANASGILLGDGKNFRPEDFVTREEAVVLLYRAYKMSAVSGELSYKDTDTIADWAREAVLAMTANGYVRGADGMFSPKRNLTRAEFLQMLENLSALPIPSFKTEEEPEVIATLPGTSSEKLPVLPDEPAETSATTPAETSATSPAETSATSPAETSATTPAETTATSATTPSTTSIVNEGGIW